MMTQSSEDNIALFLLFPKYRNASDTVEVTTKATTTPKITCARLGPKAVDRWYMSRNTDAIVGRKSNTFEADN